MIRSKKYTPSPLLTTLLSCLFISKLNIRLISRISLFSATPMKVWDRTIHNSERTTPFKTPQVPFSCEEWNYPVSILKPVQTLMVSLWSCQYTRHLFWFRNTHKNAFENIYVSHEHIQKTGAMLTINITHIWKRMI